MLYASFALKCENTSDFHYQFIHSFIYLFWFVLVRFLYVLHISYVLIDIQILQIVNQFYRWKIYTHTHMVCVIIQSCALGFNVQTFQHMNYIWDSSALTAYIGLCVCVYTSHKYLHVHSTCVQ